MMLKKFISLLLAALFIGVSVITAYGANNEIMPCFEHFDNAYASIGVNGRNITSSGSVRTDETCKVKITLELQKSSNDTSWSFYKTISSKEIDSGLLRTHRDFAYSVQSGYYYRTKAIITVSVGSSTETTIVYSNDSVYVG